jgi:hypothetical protein
MEEILTSGKYGSVAVLLNHLKSGNFVFMEL